MGEPGPTPKKLPDDDFAGLLLQRRFVSLAFTPAYDLVIDLLQDEEARRIARVILREEYPDSSGRTPSHREDMTEDLRRLGIGQRTIVASRPPERPGRSSPTPSTSSPRRAAMPTPTCGC